MSGISMITVLEIFTNAKDLEITIEQEKGEGRFAISISRGPIHNFKPILTSQPFAETVEGAVSAIKEVLETIQRVVTKELEDSESILAKLLNHDAELFDQSKVLTPDFINRIVYDLGEYRRASTYKMPTIVS